MIISLIAAMDKNRGIGFQGDIPWFKKGKSTIQGDMERFRNLTMGHPVVMGRKTYLSIGKALLGRTNIVLTRDKSFTLSDAIIMHSWKEAKKAVSGIPGSNEVFIIGGGNVFKEMLPRAHRMYLTVVKADFPADTFFPEYNMDEWNMLNNTRFVAFDANAPRVQYVDLERKTALKASSQR